MQEIDILLRIEDKLCEVVDELKHINENPTPKNNLPVYDHPRVVEYINESLNKHTGYSKTDVLDFARKRMIEISNLSDVYYPETKHHKTARIRVLIDNILKKYV